MLREEDGMTDGVVSAEQAEHMSGLVFNVPRLLEVACTGRVVFMCFGALTVPNMVAKRLVETNNPDSGAMGGVHLVVCEGFGEMPHVPAGGADPIGARGFLRKMHRAFRLEETGP